MCALATVLLLSLHTTWGARTLEGKQWLKKDTTVTIFQSLQRGPVKPSQRNPCSTVPGRSKGHCTLSEMNVAGHVALAHAAPPAYPDTLVKFGAAVAPSNTKADDTPK